MIKISKIRSVQIGKDMSVETIANKTEQLHIATDLLNWLMSKGYLANIRLEQEK